MSIPTVKVTARVHDQSGNPVERAVVTMRLTTPERYAGYVVPREVRAETDKCGLATLLVWPNELGTEHSEYRVHIRYPQQGCVSSDCCGVGSLSGYAVVPNANCDLQDIMELAPYEYRGAGQVIVSEVAMYAGQASSARDAAKSYADAAKVTADRSEGAANRAAASETAALAAAKQAETQAGVATTQATRAKGIADSFQTDVIRQVETEVKRLTTSATGTVTASRDEALEAVTERGEAVVEEVTKHAVTLKADAVNAVAKAKDQALSALEKSLERAMEDFREEAELFREDFLILTERAEAAARQAACSAAAAEESAQKSCLCAERAEAAADAAESARDDTLEAARAAERAKEAAEAAAVEARTKAEEVAKARDEVLAAEREAKESAQSARKDATQAEEAKKTAVKAAEEAKKNADRTQDLADQTQKIADDVKGAIEDAAKDILVDKIVNDAVKQATDTAVDAAKRAEDAANQTKKDADSAAKDAQDAARDADRAENAADRADQIASQMLKDYNVELAFLQMSAQMVRLADRVTQVELDHAHGMAGTGGGLLSPQGVRLPDGGLVAPITFLDAGQDPVPGAALSVSTEDYTGPDGSGGSSGGSSGSGGSGGSGTLKLPPEGQVLNQNTMVAPVTLVQGNTAFNGAALSMLFSEYTVPRKQSDNQRS